MRLRLGPRLPPRRETGGGPLTHLNWGCAGRLSPPRPEYSVCDFAERLQLRPENRLFAFKAVEFDHEALAIGISGAGDLLAQARQIALDDPQIGLDRAPIEHIWGNRLVGEHRAALRRHLGNAADNKDPPRDGLPLINLDHPRPDRRNQRRVTG